MQQLLERRHRSGEQARLLQQPACERAVEVDLPRNFLGPSVEPVEVPRQHGDDILLGGEIGERPRVDDLHREMALPHREAQVVANLRQR